MEEQIIRRLLDLANQAERTDSFTFSAFLGEADYADFCAAQRQFPNCGVTAWGGHEDAERLMLRFGDPERLGYAAEFPIVCLEIAPLQKKFADALTHRDFLGALMHLGISRAELGDLLVSDRTAYVFCTEKMAPYLCGELTRVRHTSVECRVTAQLPAELAVRVTQETVQTASLRADILIAKVFHISRGDCLDLIRAERVFLNGRTVTNASTVLKEGDRLSVRGCGKFRFCGVTGQTKKGNLLAAIERFTG